MKMPIRRDCRGFTLVELLVVIGIIALLISILIPTLGKAQDAAKTLKCLSNLRGIAQAMTIYATENKGAVLGNANTTSRHFYPPRALSNSADPGSLMFTATTIPDEGPISVTDWAGPVLQVMRVKIPISNDVITRYQFYRDQQALQCPSNYGVLSASFSTNATIDAGAGQALSYVTNLNMMFTTQSPTGVNTHPGITGITRGSFGEGATHNGYPQIPEQMRPNLTKIKNGSSKIFVADGGKFVSSTVRSTYNLNVSPTQNSGAESGPYADFGVPFRQTRAYDRTVANGTTVSDAVDARVYSYRHGAKGEKQKFGSYKLNAAFFDGHAETLREDQAIDVNLWLHTGTKLYSTDRLWPDVIAKNKMSTVSPTNVWTAR